MEEPKIEEWRLKQLLSDIEENGGRYHAKLSSICNANASWYGSQGSKMRQRIQKKFDLLKRHQGSVYLDLLLKHGVAPSAESLHGTGAKFEEEVEEINEDISSDTDDSMAPSAFALLNLSNSSSTNFHTTTSPQRTPPRNSSLLQKKSPPASMTRVMRSPSPVAPFGLLNAVGNGTLNHPFVVVVDVNCPERNNGFNIQVVDNMLFNDSLHYGFHIRKFIPFHRI